MNQEQLIKPYQAFFTDNEAGKYFVTELYRLIDVAHKEAEDNPESARDCVQRAKGIREVLSHITSVGTEIKRGRQ